MEGAAVSVFDSLVALAGERAEVRDLGKGHFQVVGKVVVNYYPYSQDRTAYVNGMTQSIKGVTPEQAAAWALDPERIPCPGKGKRRRSYAKLKRRMYQSQGKCCHWCGQAMTLEEASVDHVIPVSRGGADRADNRVLAHQACNSQRGNKMPIKRRTKP